MPRMTANETREEMDSCIACIDYQCEVHAHKSVDGIRNGGNAFNIIVGRHKSFFNFFRFINIFVDE